MSDLEDMLKLQLELQKSSMKDGNPQHLTGDDMATFMTWNAFALTGEVHEAMQEVGWKPWASNRSIAEQAFLKEMVDAFHFFMNMLLCALPDSPEVIAEKFVTAYEEKNRENARRQEEGYTGTNKCPGCGRDLKEFMDLQVISTATGKAWCTAHCHAINNPEGETVDN